MSKLEVIAFHGWGFDATCWQSWEKLIPDHVLWKNFDRGYFGSSQWPEFSAAVAKKTIITHSFGFHLCRDDLMKQADLLVIMSGFKQFHPSVGAARKRSKLVLRRMINQFDEQPQEVLQSFYERVFHPAEDFDPPPDELNKKRLLADLNRLNEADRALPTHKKSAKVCIFHGAEDRIVSIQKGQALSRLFGDRASYCELPGAGHALPMRRAKKLWTMIKENVLAANN